MEEGESFYGNNNSFYYPNNVLIKPVSEKDKLIITNLHRQLDTSNSYPNHNVILVFKDSNITIIRLRSKNLCMYHLKSTNLNSKISDEILPLN